MAANTSPIYTLKGKLEWCPTVINAANTAKDGTGVVNTIVTADATNGSFIQKIKFRPAGTNVATVARIFINNGLTNATPSNNILYDELSLPASTTSETSATIGIEVYLNFVLPSGYNINVTLGTAVAAGYYVSAIGGDY